MITMQTEKLLFLIHFHFSLLKQMSDPLTALMHAVQVMNLLKTLILKTLRDREETATAGYSSMSFHSSDPQSEDDYDSQQEMDTSGELRGTKSDCDDHDVDYSRNSEEEEEEEKEEAASVSEIEECFMKQLDDENTKGISEEPAGYLQEELESPRSCSGNNMESVISFTDTKTENSCSCSTYEDDSRTTTLTAEERSNDVTSSLSIGSTGTDDVEMIDKFTDSVSLLPLFASS